MQKKKSFNLIKNIISIAVFVILIYMAYTIYQKYNFNDYIKAEYNMGFSKFERDSNVKYGNTNSYKIENTNLQIYDFLKGMK